MANPDFSAMDAGTSLMKQVSRILMLGFGLLWFATANANETAVPGIPSYLEKKESATGYTVTRVSGVPGTPIDGHTDRVWGNQVRHQYSKISPWNCDQSLLLLLNRGGKPGTLILNGKNYQPTALTPDFWYQEMRWHPTKRDQIIYARGNSIGAWNVRNNTREVLITLDEYNKLYFGPWEGNPSDDGQWIVVAAETKPVKAVFALNLNSKVAKKPIEHGFASVDFATISPSGAYIVINGVRAPELADRTAVFRTADGSLVQRWDQFGQPSHFDLDLSTNGLEVAIGVAKSGPFEGSLIARSLANSRIRSLRTPGYGVHTSARNIAGAARVVGSFSGIENARAPGSDMIAIVRIGQQNPFLPIAQAGTASSWNYWAQSQPVISPWGNKIAWASSLGSEETVGAFVAEIDPDLSMPTKSVCKP